MTLTNQVGQATSYTYTASGQVASVTLADGSNIAYTYDPSGRLATATDAAGTITLSYDARGHFSRIAYPNGQSLTYSYDAAGRRTKMVDQSGYTVNYLYDSTGRLVGLADGSNAPIVSYAYNKLGQITRQDLGNGTATTYAYDAAGNVLDQVNLAVGGAVASRFDYTFDALGRVATMSTLDGTWSYTYDTANQLTRAVFASTNNAVPSQDLSYAYDAAGNRTQAVLNGATSTYATNGLNQYQSVTSPDGTTTYTYDGAGNLISEAAPSGTTTYAYDSLSRLTGITSPTDTRTYKYDALGNRSAVTHNGVTTTNLIDPAGAGLVVGEFDASNGPIAHNNYALGLVSRVTPGGTTYYAFDGLGSTVGSSDSGGNATGSASYDPFGGTLASTLGASNPFGFLAHSASRPTAAACSTWGRRIQPEDRPVRLDRPAGPRGRRREHPPLRRERPRQQHGPDGPR